MKIVVVASDLENNSLGRIYCLWLLANSLGWECRVVSIIGERVWGPLSGTEFAAYCTLATETSELRSTIESADLVIAGKPFPSSLGLAYEMTQASNVPLIVDIDDPDLEVAFSGGYTLAERARRVARESFHPRRMAGLRRMRQLIPGLTVTASNPVLAGRYGATVIPHVRPPAPQESPRTSRGPVVAFVGTVRAHKGIEMLRTAVRELSDGGFRLVITDSRPTDAKPWEHWVGRTSLHDGLLIVQQADIVAIPSLRTPYSEGQLPVKLIDGMFAGRAIIASDLPPVRWALGDGGVLVEPGSAGCLRQGLELLGSSETRLSLGRIARARAETSFSVDSVAPLFGEVCLAAIGRQ